MILRTKDITPIVWDLTNKYLLIILKKLGFREKPQNLIIKTSETYDYALGVCLAFFNKDTMNELSAAVVVIYPSNIIWLKIFNWLRIPRLCMFSRILLERKILYVLAHELRHYWQYYTGEYKKHRQLSKFFPRSINMLEVDAEKWAEEFIRVYSFLPKISSLSI
ncbi:hypothetical protein [Desulfolucanica intricata]|uniref:hypothetical protein n=1 Tax=Desulfolucanica intricata TaxID=1285191 RepID=UPI00082E9F9A|nr:hypothetical protein [Desulfolucanica intricata]